MSKEIGISLMILAAFIAATSQVVLKKSANKNYKNLISNYLNIRIILAYGMLLTSMVLNILAYKNIDYKLGPILNSTSYIFVAIFSFSIFKENITARKITGCILIIVGIIIYNL